MLFVWQHFFTYLLLHSTKVILHILSSRCTERYW